MAHVAPPERESVGRRRERAQLFIVIGLVLAITLVSLALFLNSIIYAGNLGSRGSGIGDSEAAAFVTTVESEGQHQLRDAREEDGDGGYVVREDEFKTSIREWNEQSQLHYTSRGAYTNVAVANIAPDGSFARLSVTYENSRIEYESTITVVPGGTDG